MKRYLVNTYDGVFRASIKDNYVADLPSWTTQLLTDEWSPFKTFLGTVQPDVKVRLVVGLEVVE